MDIIDGDLEMGERVRLILTGYPVKVRETSTCTNIRYLLLEY
jgi:hypothetical protein